MRYRRILWGQLLVACVLLGVLALPSHAAGHGCDPVALDRLANLQSRAALQQFVRCAASHVDDVGWAQALEDFATEKKWRDGPVYLFGVDAEGAEIFDAGVSDGLVDYPDGIPPVERFLYTVGTFSQGYVSYMHRHPETREFHPKQTYFFPAAEPYEGRQVYLGAGFYPITSPATCDPEQVRASLVYRLEDAERFVRCAELYIEQHGLLALHELRSDPRWNFGATYLFLLDRESLVAVLHGANPDLEGTYLGDLEDSTGYRFVEEFAVQAELYGDGITYYEFINPATGGVDPKISYYKNVDILGFDYILGAGIYTPSDLGCMEIPDAKDIDTKEELVTFVRCAAEMVANRGEGSYDLLLNHRDWIEGSTYIFINNQNCGTVIYPLEYRSDIEDCDATTDSQGTYLLREIRDVSASEEGEGFVTYIWLNPATNREEVKTSYVVGVEMDGEILSVGAGVYGLD